MEMQGKKKKKITSSQQLIVKTFTAMWCLQKILTLTFQKHKSQNLKLPVKKKETLDQRDTFENNYRILCIPHNKSNMMQSVHKCVSAWMDVSRSHDFDETFLSKNKLC